MMVEELIFSSHSKTFDQDIKDSDNSSTQLTSRNESLFKWLERDYLFFLTGSGQVSDSSPSMWAEWELLEALL
jgi:hypothetical protein